MRVEQEDHHGQHRNCDRVAEIGQKEIRIHAPLLSGARHLEVQKQHPNHRLRNLQSHFKLTKAGQNVPPFDCIDLPQLTGLTEIHFREQFRINEIVVRVHLFGAGGRD